MGVSNETAVCLECRRSARVAFLRRESVCSKCRKPMIVIGKHWRIPKRHNDAGWKRLRELIKLATERGVNPSYYLTAHGVHLLDKLRSK